MDNQDRLVKIQKMARGLSCLLVVGLLGAITSCFEDSWVWTAYCVLMCWLGIAMGLGSGTGLADQLMGQLPAHRQTTKAAAKLWALMLFWIPTLALMVFGIVLAGALREDLQPTSYQEENSLALILQSATFYFSSAGACWAIVLREVNHALAEGEPPSASES